MFSTLLIHECGLLSGEPKSFLFDAAPSFPCPAWEQEIVRPSPESWIPKDVTKAVGCLELSLQGRISEGRIGATFVARVVAATQGGNDVRSALPETVCLKFAKKEFCRSLAREAWIYERLADSCQGTSVPRCHGFFSSTMAKQPGYPDVIFVPWKERVHQFEDTDPIAQTNSSPDWLSDDRPELQRSISDLAGLKQGSSWNTWQRDGINPTLAVLVLDLLGHPCDGRRTAQDKEDITAVFDDIATCGVYHENPSPWNVLAYQGPENPQARCSRHNVFHRWRVIDFDRTLFVDVHNTTPCITYFVHSTKRSLNYANAFCFRSS